MSEKVRNIQEIGGSTMPTGLQQQAGTDIIQREVTREFDGSESGNGESEAGVCLKLEVEFLDKLKVKVMVNDSLKERTSTRILPKIVRITKRSQRGHKSVMVRGVLRGCWRKTRRPPILWRREA